MSEVLQLASVSRVLDSLYWGQKTQRDGLTQKGRRLEFDDVHRTNQVGSQCFFLRYSWSRLVYPEKLPWVRSLC